MCFGTWKNTEILLYRVPVCESSHMLRDLGKFRAPPLKRARDRSERDASRHICSGIGKIPSSFLFMVLKSWKNFEVLLYKEPGAEALSDDMKHNLYFSHVKSSICTSHGRGESVRRPKTFFQFLCTFPFHLRLLLVHVFSISNDCALIAF